MGLLESPDNFVIARSIDSEDFVIGIIASIKYSFQRQHWFHTQTKQWAPLSPALKRAWMDAPKQKHFVCILLMFAKANKVADRLARAVCACVGSPHVMSQPQAQYLWVYIRLNLFSHTLHALQPTVVVIADSSFKFVFTAVVVRLLFTLLCELTSSFLQHAFLHSFVCLILCCRGFKHSIEGGDWFLFVLLLIYCCTLVDSFVVFIICQFVICWRRQHLSAHKHTHQGI